MSGDELSDRFMDDFKAIDPEAGRPVPPIPVADVLARVGVNTSAGAETPVGPDPSDGQQVCDPRPLDRVGRGGRRRFWAVVAAAVAALVVGGVVLADGDRRTESIDRPPGSSTPTSNQTSSQTSTTGPAGGDPDTAGDRTGETVVVDFDDPEPPGEPFVGNPGLLGELDGVFQGIDFGEGVWRWERPPTGGTNLIFFTDETRFSGEFGFASGARELVSLEVSSPVEGELTVSDDQGRTLTVAVGSDPLVVTPAWDGASSQIRLEFTAGWELLVTSISYR